MKEFFEKLAPYHFFNYLMPGGLFLILLENITHYRIQQQDIVFNLILCYFIGLTISRLGSLVFQPLFQKIKLVIYSDYSDYLSAVNKDPKLDTLSEVSNMYRTIFSCFLTLLLLKIYELFDILYLSRFYYDKFILIGLLFVLFLYSYKKQTEYINQRVGILSKQKRKK